MGRVLALDPGTVRIGLAISDPEGIVATALETLDVADGDVESRIAAIAEQNGATSIVVGLPKSLSGREAKPAQEARRLAERLRGATGVPVDLWDERFTSAEAERAMRAAGTKGPERRKSRDRVAATLLLQSYLDASRQAARTRKSR